MDAVIGRRLDSPHRVVTVGPNDIILDCSPAAADWLGVEPAALIGVHVERLEAALGRRVELVAASPAGDDDLVERTFRVVPNDGDAEVLRRTVGVAVRDRGGWIDHVVLAIGHPVG